MGNNVAKAFDRARVRRVLPERSVSSRVLIIGSEFRQNSPQMLFVDHDQMDSGKLGVPAAIGTSLASCDLQSLFTPHEVAIAITRRYYRLAL